MKTIIALSLLLLSFLSCQKKEKNLDDTLQKAITWMWQQQSDDGGWHSQTHAVLRDGKVLTPYILFQLIENDDTSYPVKKERIEQAVEFIVRSMKSSLNVDSSAIIEYPNYSAAYALRVLHKLNQDTVLQQLIADYLLQQEFTGRRGFNEDSLAFGGWGYGEPDLKTGEHGHEDLSHTRRVIQALTESHHLPESIRDSIMLFLKGVQRCPDDPRLYEGCILRAGLPYDGGFVSSVVTLATNKSQPVMIENAGIHYPSYATATCDGLLALVAAGLENTTMYYDAASWLKKNQHFTTIDGLSVNDPEQWTYVMHYYHLSVRSEAMTLIDPKGSWIDSISTILIREQLPDGYYVNPSGGVNKEDDPLMATIFCIQAGGIVLRSDSMRT